MLLGLCFFVIHARVLRLSVCGTLGSALTVTCGRNFGNRADDRKPDRIGKLFFAFDADIVNVDNKDNTKGKDSAEENADDDVKQITDIDRSKI